MISCFSDTFILSYLIGYFPQNQPVSWCNLANQPAGGLIDLFQTNKLSFQIILNYFVCQSHLINGKNQASVSDITRDSGIPLLIRHRVLMNLEFLFEHQRSGEPHLTDASKLFNDLLMQLGSFECQLKVVLIYSKQLMGTSATDLSQKYRLGFPGAAFPKLLLMALKTATCFSDTEWKKRGQWAMARGTRGIFGCLMDEFMPKIHEDRTSWTRKLNTL